MKYLYVKLLLNNYTGITCIDIIRITIIDKY